MHGESEGSFQSSTLRKEIEQQLKGLSDKELQERLRDQIEKCRELEIAAELKDRGQTDHATGSSSCQVTEERLIERFPYLHVLLRLLWLLLKITVVLSIMVLIGQIFELAGGYVVVLGVLLFLVYIYCESKKS